MSILPYLTASCVAPAIVARLRKQPSAVTLLLLALSLTALGIAGIASIFVDWRAGWVLIAAVPLLCIVGVLPARTSGVATLLAALRRRRRLRGFILMLGTLVVLLGGAEWCILVLTKIGAIEVESPVVINLVNEDWREAAIIGDHAREPDPVLFWRPRPTPPYNAQRFQGPIAQCPKPDGVFRIMCYGDSNTDGHTGDGGWPACLGKLLQEQEGTREWRRDQRVEVINAGVIGYSSHQGIMRFREEVAEYTPDLVFVSFGWNDAPEALGKADKEFAIPAAGVLYLQRTLLRLRSYRLVYAALRPRAPAAEVKTVGPRVPIDDYIANLSAFRDVAAQHGAQVVLLTRPHRDPAATLWARTDWRRTVPEYNRSLLDFAAREGIACVDVNANFASHPELFVDECHFSSTGHQRMAELLAVRLTELLTR